MLLWTHIMLLKDLSVQVKQTIVRLQKQNKSIREIAGTFGVAKSTVWYILRKKRTHWWAQQHKKAWTSTEDNSGGWSENPLHGKEKPFHNIHPSEEHSPGGKRVTVKVYNQEKTSREQIQRVHHKVQTRPGQTLPKKKKKHLKNPDHFWKSILWTAEIMINLYQNDGKKKVWRRLGTAHDPKHTTSSVKHDGAVCRHEHAWLPVALGYWCLLMTWPKTEAARLILKCIGIYSLPIQSNAAKLVGRRFIVQVDNDPKHTAKQSRSFWR